MIARKNMVKELDHVAIHDADNEATQIRRDKRAGALFKVFSATASKLGGRYLGSRDEVGVSPAFIADWIASERKTFDSFCHTKIYSSSSVFEARQ